MKKLFLIAGFMSVAFVGHSQDQWTFQQGVSNGNDLCRIKSETGFRNSINWALENNQIDYANGLRSALEQCDFSNKGSVVLSEEVVHTGCIFNLTGNLHDFICGRTDNSDSNQN